MKAERIILRGEVPNPADPLTIHPRCAYKTELCEQVIPPLQQLVNEVTKERVR
jgi:hypothetical protein